MKRILAFTLSFILMLCMIVGCSENPDGPADTTDTNDSVTEDNKQPTFKYEHVVLLGVDGGGTFFRNTDTPNIDRIFENGAISYNVLTSDPTISAQCWGSMLTGVKPEFHHLSNAVVESSSYPVDSKFPTLFRVIRENNQDAVLASWCNWSPINSGIIEDNINVSKSSGSDSEITDSICNYIKDGNAPTMLFVQFDECDGAGHSSGYGQKAHLDQITTTDGYIGRIYDAYKDAGLLDTTLFIVTADHGGAGTSHGGLTDEEKYVMYAAVGPTVTKGTIQDMEIRDNAAIILHALGIEQPETWTARVPSGLFEGVTAGERPVYELTYLYDHRTHESSETPNISTLKDIFGDRLSSYFTFDDTISDAAGNMTTTETGKIYYTDGYFGKAAQFDDGYISATDFAPDKSSFSLGFWMKTAGVGSDPVLLSNKNWNDGYTDGFVLSLREADIKFNVGNGSDRLDVDNTLPADYANGWVYFAMVVDRDNGVVRFSYDFGAFAEYSLESLSDSSFNCFNNLNIGQDGTGSYSESLSAAMDELLLINGIMSDADLAALATHYGAK